MSLQFETVGVVGTGAMGRGIAQIAAQAGSQVWLFDAKPGAAEQAATALSELRHLGGDGQAALELGHCLGREFALGMLLLDLFFAPAQSCFGRS